MVFAGRPPSGKIWAFKPLTIVMHRSVAEDILQSPLAMEPEGKSDVFQLTPYNCLPCKRKSVMENHDHISRSVNGR